MGVQKTSKVFYKVGFILSIIAIVALVILMISLPAAWGQSIKDSTGKVYTADQVATAIAVYEVVFAFLLAHNIVNIVVSVKARNHPTKTLHILGIIFGIASGVEFSAVGGILGLVALSKENANKTATVETTNK